MSWPGLLIRVIAVIAMIIIADFSQSFLAALGIPPTYVAKVLWNLVLWLPILLISLAAAKRVDAKVSERRKL